MAKKSPKGMISMEELMKSKRDTVLSHLSTLFAAIMAVGTGALVAYFSGSDFTSTINEMGATGVILKLLADQLIPYLNRVYNFYRI